MENNLENLIIKDELSNEEIKKLIYTIRGKQVMIDSDVAMLYHYKTKVLNLTVRRNVERFPEEFCFQLTEIELQDLRFQIETSKRNKEINSNLRGGRRYLPYAFTEQGVAMLAGVLKSDIAVKVSIDIIKSFIEMRKFMSLNQQVFERLTNVEYKLLENDKKFDDIFNELQKGENEFKQKIFFEGQIYDAYSLIIDIIKKATKFHDRFIVIDDKEMYHLGASIKDLGKKCFGINKIEDIDVIERIIDL